MRIAIIKYGHEIAGYLMQEGQLGLGDFVFTYDAAYIQHYPNRFITFDMPVQRTPYRSKRLFPFFEGLLPEGWLLDIACKTWDLPKTDRMGLLLACCKHCIGAVSVHVK